MHQTGSLTYISPKRQATLSAGSLGYDNGKLHWQRFYTFTPATCEYMPETVIPDDIYFVLSFFAAVKSHEHPWKYHLELDSGFGNKPMLLSTMSARRFWKREFAIATHDEQFFLPRDAMRKQGIAVGRCLSVCPTHYMYVLYPNRQNFSRSSSPGFFSPSESNGNPICGGVKKRWGWGNFSKSWKRYKIGPR